MISTMDPALWLTLPSLIGAVVYFGLPWQPWRPGPVLEAGDEPEDDAESLDVTVLIPARNEAPTIGAAVTAARAQASGLRVVVINDHSEDTTAEAAAAAGAEVVTGLALPHGWLGKPWALEQGLARVDTRWVLLLDADIELRRGLLRTLCERAERSGAHCASLLAAPALRDSWSRALMPAFVYFFLALYPFRLANDPRSRVAAAAGGCALVDVDALRGLGGFHIIRDALIDDCRLAGAFKRAGYRTWIGLSRSVLSRRAAGGLHGLWRMVARSAYTQLGHSLWRLGGCTLAMSLLYVLPLTAFARPPIGPGLGLAAWGLVAATQVPTLRFYGLNPLRALLLPFIALLYLAMTWHSAWWHWRGQGPEWKGRRYAPQPAGRQP